MLPIPLKDQDLPPTAELDLAEFHAEIIEPLKILMASGGQAIRGVTITMHALSAESRNTYL